MVVTFRVGVRGVCCWSVIVNGGNVTNLLSKKIIAGQGEDLPLVA